MTNRFINADDAFASPSYTQAVETTAGSRLLTISGQVGVTPDGKAPADFEGQARLAFDNLGKQLGAGGMGWGDLVKMTVIVTDPAYVAPFRALRSAALGDHRPASTLIVAGLADPSWMVEIEAVAAQ